MYTTEVVSTRLEVLHDRSIQQRTTTVVLHVICHEASQDK